MTLAVSIIAKDGIILASDSRMGSTLYSNDTVDKIIQLSDHIAVGIAGDGTLASHIFDLVKKEKKLDLDKGILYVAEQLGQELANFFDRYYSNISFRDRDPLDILLVGYTLFPESKPQIYNLSSSDNFIPRQSPAGHNSIGIPHIANYHLNRIYEKDRINSEQAAKLSVFCIKETGSQYRSVGGDVKVAIFSDKKKFALISKSEMSNLETQCDLLQKSQKYRFYPEEEGMDDKNNSIIFMK